MFQNNENLKHKLYENLKFVNAMKYPKQTMSLFLMTVQGRQMALFNFLFN